MNFLKNIKNMKTSSLIQNIEYNAEKPKVELLLDTEFTKEIRILLKAGQVMKEHQTPYPIVVELFEGKIDFGVEDEIHHLTKGDILTLSGKVPHDLKALEDSIVRLTLSKGDKIERVKEVSEK